MGSMSVEVTASGQPLIEQPLIDLRDVSQQVRTGELILRGISLQHRPRRAGGDHRGQRDGQDHAARHDVRAAAPPAGEVRRDGEQDRHGYVPQDDIIHLTLPLRRTLRYTAGLRLPAATTPDQAEHAVTEVLKALELTDRADVPVGSLSGGQRKRASIAAELLTRPGVFFLDEPTSGLDPARGAELMRTLRQLAAEGTTVVLTTHNPLDAERCDRVAVLADHGYLAFFGSPERAQRLLRHRQHLGDVRAAGRTRTGRGTGAAGSPNSAQPKPPEPSARTQDPPPAQPTPPPRPRARFAASAASASGCC